MMIRWFYYNPFLHEKAIKKVLYFDEVCVIIKISCADRRLNMVNLKYLARVASGASFGKMNSVVNKVHEKCGKWKPLIYADIIWCILAYGAVITTISCTASGR